MSDRLESSRHVSRHGVLLIGHGTRDPIGTQQFFELGNRLAESMHPTPTESALLEFQHPTIAEGWEALMRRQVQHVHVAPLLLFAAGHAKQDIPDEVARCRDATTEVTFDQSRPLSRHPAIIELVVERVQAALTETNAATERTALVMVGRGNRDPCAQADMRVLTELVRHRVPCHWATTAFYAMASPPLPDVLDSVATSGKFDSVIVYPHLLFEGRLLEAIGRLVSEASQRHPAIHFQAAEHLGPDRRVAQALHDRILQSANQVTGVEC